jgi:hypothetical protein
MPRKPQRFAEEKREVTENAQTRCRFRAVHLAFIGSAIVLAGLPCSAQTVLGPGTVITGQCHGHESEPGCVLPNLFGSGGLTLQSNPAFSHYAHYVGSAQTTLNQTLSTAIATQLAILPIISPASGFTYKYDSAAGAFVRSTTSFGPIYTERAETIGRGKFSFGISYQRFRFSNLDGIDLHNVPAVFTHLPGTGPNHTDEPYEADVISTSNSINLNMDQTLLYGTVGITDRLDFSVAIPIVSVRMGVSSDANIIRVSGPTFTPVGAPPTTVIQNPHQFNSQGSLTNVFTSNGSASGIGDVTFRVKGNIFNSEAVRVALAMDVRAPTGDAREYLGSGAVGIKPFIAVSAGKRFSPHLNLGYQWNGSSILAGDLTGVTISEDQNENEIVQNGKAAKKDLPDQLFYSVGADVGVTNRLSLAFDYLGQVLIDAPRVFESTTVTQNVPGGTGALTLPTITGGKDTIGLNSAAAGLKYNLFGKLLVTADLLFRLDNKGLRQDVTPLIALSYAFGQ